MPTIRLFFIAALLSTCSVVSAVEAGTKRCSARAERPVAILELYTSEGCSSCPPADSWLSSLKSKTDLSQRLVPLAFHVDYWDYIGWKDRFADPRFSERQRELVKRAGSRVVVTPQVLLNGRPLNGGNWNRDVQRVLDSQANQAPEVVLELVATRVEDGWSVVLNGNTPQTRKLRVFLARFEQGLSSSVTAGENKGARLNHDFVVRNWEGPIQVQSNRVFELSHTFKLDAKAGGETGFAAVVEDADTGVQIQAVATKVCSS